MDNKMTKIRKEFIEAHETYLHDVKWLREKFGIIVAPKDFTLKAALAPAIDFILKDDSESLEKSLKAFKEFHRKIIYDVAWDLLERSKENLKLLQNADLELFEEKRQLWVKASWALSEAIYRKNFTRYYDSIDISSTI